MNAARAALLFEFVKPIFQACGVVLTFCVGVYALTRPRTIALLLLASACFVTTVADAIYFSGSLQTQWKITVFPVDVRRVLFLLAELLFIVEVFLWPVALILLIRERRASLSPTI